MSGCTYQHIDDDGLAVCDLETNKNREPYCCPGGISGGCPDREDELKTCLFCGTKLKASNASVTAFGIYFNAVQEDFNRMMEKLREIDAADPATAEKLRVGARTILSKILERIPENKEGKA